MLKGNRAMTSKIGEKMAGYRILGAKYKIKCGKNQLCTSGPVKTCHDGIMCGRNVLGQTPVKDK